MGNRNYTRIVLPTLRYKSAPKSNLNYQVPLKQNYKEVIQYDRTKSVNLLQVFDNERQTSTSFRPTAKFSILFQNAYTGSTNYTPFENNLYYVNETAAAIRQCDTNPQSVAWSGFPQYFEFDFIRTDNNVIGYTKPPLNHINFVNKSATTYNWMYYMSYAYENDTNTKLLAYENSIQFYHYWNAGDGIPFIIENRTSNGLPVVSFRCPVKHGLNVGEFVKLNQNFVYNSGTTHQIYSLGDGLYGSEEYIFNIVNPGFTGNTFDSGKNGLAKRFILGNYETESMSKYYVRKNKILTNLEDAVLVKAGFEQSIFGSKKKYESSGLTPDRQARVSVKEGSQSYTLSFNRDINISNLVDNQKRPITELFFTVLWRGYFGWFLDETKPIRNGYEFNLPLVNNSPSAWWSIPLSVETGFTYNNFQTIVGGLGNSGLKFYSTNPIKEGDVLHGDFCEWNDYLQEERVISSNYHKIVFNPNNFDISTINPSNPLGYYYKPHHKLTLRVYSDYIEEGTRNQIVDVPNYSFFSNSQNLFIWRDLYQYGFVDSTGLGVDYPFLNGKHYPYESYFFRIIPEGTNYTEGNPNQDPDIDECE